MKNFPEFNSLKDSVNSNRSQDFKPVDFAAIYGTVPLCMSVCSLIFNVFASEFVSIFGGSIS